MEWANQLQLHAKKVVLRRDSGREVHIEAPLPGHMQMCLEGLGFAGPN